ncbi:hypothetical protein [Halorubrum sp. CBA1125]|uniref:hypothetical protein n=1 Tax=Halorubrum sp. CBA1125 TaxID=2668072 RepID=UPI001E30F177|nr:hypothetical protein [Halorubrum sp. CBA1125]
MPTGSGETDAQERGEETDAAVRDGEADAHERGEAADGQGEDARERDGGAAHRVNVD